MWAGRPAGAADETNPVAARNGLAGANPNLSHMRIQGGEAVAVAEHHRVAVAVSPTCTQHDAISAGNNILAEVAVEVDALVGSHNAENWMHPVAEGARHHPGHWPMGEHEISRDARVIGAIIVICAFVGPGVVSGSLLRGFALSFSFSFKSLNLTRDFPVGSLDFGTNGSPLGDPFLDLVPQYLRVTLRVVELGEADFQIGSFSFYRGNQVLGHSLSLGLLGFLGAKFIDKVVFVSDHLLPQRLSSGRSKKVAGIEFGETTIPRADECLNSAATQSGTHPVDLFVDVRCTAPRLGGFFFGGSYRLETGSDFRLLEPDMGIDGSECRREFSILC